MTATRDIQLPADSILHLRRALIRDVGTDAANRALQEAGHGAGDALFERLGKDENAIGSTPEQTFWQRLAQLFGDLDWGTLEHSTPHPGVGALTGHDWFEVEDDARRPACPFTTGVLANILGHAAGGEVSVLQVPCDNDEVRCVRFLFGAPATLDRLYSGLRDGQDVETSLAALG